MEEISSAVLNTEVKNITAVLKDGILPFAERPSLNYRVKKEEPGDLQNEINASELFSLFTADIIKEKIIFTR